MAWLLALLSEMISRTRAGIFSGGYFDIFDILYP
jgi:hypothetical protein